MGVCALHERQVELLSGPRGFPNLPKLGFIGATWQHREPNDAIEGDTPIGDKREETAISPRWCL